MLKKLTYSLILLVMITSAALAQSRTMYIGNVELRLGMPQDAALKLLGPYKVASMGGIGFSVGEYDQVKKLYNILGVVSFQNNQLVSISRDMDTSGWPNDEGFAVGRAIYEALNTAIPLTDSDGAKRATANIIIENRDANGNLKGNLRRIAIYLNERKVSVLIWDGVDGKSVSASVAIQLKPW